MIGPGSTQILVATKPVDFRKQADSLAALVQQALGADPFSGTVYVFRAKRADRVKLIWWDGTGLILLSKRLEAGSSAGRAQACCRSTATPATTLSPIRRGLAER
jgi:transposase